MEMNVSTAEGTISKSTRCSVFYSTAKSTLLGKIILLDITDGDAAKV